MQLVVQTRGTSCRPGDRLVTFGSVNYKPYVPGVPGRHDRAVTQRAPGRRPGRHRHAVRRLHVARPVGVVVQPPPRDPRDAVLGAATPSGTPSSTPSASTSSSPSAPVPRSVDAVGVRS